MSHLPYGLQAIYFVLVYPAKGHLGGAFRRSLCLHIVWGERIKLPTSTAKRHVLSIASAVLWQHLTGLVFCVLPELEPVTSPM